MADARWRARGTTALTRSTLAAAAGLVTIVLLVAPSPAHGAAGASTQGGWHVAATLGLGSEDTAVSCATTTSCHAVEGGELLASTDGGATWVDATGSVPAGVSALDDIACPTDQLCYLTAMSTAGLPVWLVLRHGQPTVDAVPGTAELPTISCVSARHCLTTDGTDVYTTRDGGTTWSTTALPLIVYTEPALTCVLASASCWVVGDRGETPLIEASTDGGRSWETQTAPPTTDGLYDVACPSSSTCFAVGADTDDESLAIATTDGGTTWTTQPTPAQAYPLRSVSCASPTSCWAAGQAPGGAPYVFATTDGGATWVTQDLQSPASGGSPYLACGSVSRCAAVSGGITWSTVDGGQTWLSTEVPTVVEAPQALSCPSRSHCVAVADDSLGRPNALSSGDGGDTWSRHAMPAKAERLWDVACPVVAQCYAVSSGTPARPWASVAHVLTSDDGGTTWRLGRLPDDGGVLGQLTCPSSTTCLAGGYDKQSSAKLVVTTDSGASWQAVTPPPGAFYLDGLSCASVTSCVVITETIEGTSAAWTTSDLGATYQQHGLPAGTGYNGVGCAGSTCVAVGADASESAIAVSLDGGVTWTARQFPRVAQTFGKVTCGSPTTCAATAYDYAQGGGPLVVGTRDAGKTWRAYSLPARQEQPLAVACVEARCIASDASTAGNPLILAGRA